MAFLSNLFNPAQGAGFTAQSAPVATPVNTAQTQGAVGQAQSGIDQQQAFLQALQGQNGLQNQSSVYNQLQGVANGTGPNPAQAQLAQATGANVANQAALMAGQRGASQNVGLLARQAGQQGAAAQQNAAGQAATLQANQSLGALGQLGGLATSQVGQQANALQNYNALAQGQQNSLLGQTNAQNSANLGNISQQNSANAGIAGQNAGVQGKIVGGLASGIGSALMLAEGGQVSPPTTGMATSANQSASLKEGGYKGKSKVGHHLHMLAQGGKVPALVSPGERYLPPSEVKKVEAGKKDPMKAGEKIPGKRTAKGTTNSYADDTVPKTLEKGGIVLPNSVTQSKNPHWAAHAFVSEIMRKKGSLK